MLNLTLLMNSSLIDKQPLQRAERQALGGATIHPFLQTIFHHKDRLPGPLLPHPLASGLTQWTNSPSDISYSPLCISKEIALQNFNTIDGRHWVK